MPSIHELANSSAREAFVRKSRKTLFARCSRTAVFSLLLAVGCTSARAPENHPIAHNDESGTGTRAKGEQGHIGATGALLGDKELVTERNVPEPAAPSIPPVPPAPPAQDMAEAAKPAISPPLVQGLKSAPKRKDSSQQQYGVGGLGLSGIGQGGSGIGAGHGRLSGSHKSASPAATGAYAQPRVAASAVQVAPGTTTPEEFNTEAYQRVQENPFLLVKNSPLSTFSVDVDTASYSNMRRFVLGDQLPPADSIRVEEWINYFSYDDPLPAAGEPVEVASEVTDCPWAPGHRLLRVALNTAPIAQDAVPPRNLVFLIDVSGSMQPANKLPLLKRGLAMLARQLRPQDTLSMVVYAGASGLALTPTSGADQNEILGALGNLESGGSTNGAEGIELAYKVAQDQFKKGGINRVILASDGDFNVGITSEGGLERLIEEKRKSGVFLTVLGFGEGNLKDATMEKLADKGNGQYAYIDDLTEARKVLVHQAGATLVTVAKDVKLQLEFNPARVKSYRLVGYENRLLADRDFNDDKKDAGEMGAGHHVTAFYEIVPQGAPATSARAASATAPSEVDPLKYQNERTPSAAADGNELVTVKIRYKPPTGDKSLLFSRVVSDRTMPLASTSESLRFGAAVAQYALTLRGAPGMTRERLASARTLASGAIGKDPRSERREFLALMDRATHLQK